MGEMYYLYLVELGRISDSEYIPEIIQNPASSVMGSDEWYVEAQTYHVRHNCIDALNFFSGKTPEESETYIQICKQIETLYKGNPTK